MSNFNNRIQFVIDAVAAAVIGVTGLLAVVGGITVFAGHDVLREIHNEATCDETCSVMDLRNMHQESSCWCGDDDHSIRVQPFAWENDDGTHVGRAMADTTEISAAP